MAKVILTMQIIFFIKSNVNAEVLRWPQACKQGFLEISNASHEPLQAWLQQWSSELQNEDEIIIPAQSKRSLTLETNETVEKFSLVYATHQPQLTVAWKCPQIRSPSLTYPANSIEGGQLSFRQKPHDLNQIWLQNLQNSEIKIDLTSSLNNKLKKSITTIELKAFESKIINTESFKLGKSFTLTSNKRYNAYQITRSGSRNPDKIQAIPSETSTDAFYFLVTTRNDQGLTKNNEDSFVIQIKNKDLANKARELIKNPQLEKMIFARIQKDHFGFNRNHSHIEKPFWSWSTSEVTGFADLGSTSCNGTPQLLEDHLEQWLVDPGQICFWNYRVSRELSIEEVTAISTSTLNTPTEPQPKPSALRFLQRSLALFRF